MSRRVRSEPDLGLRPIPVSRYTSRTFHELEKERLWARTWQMACREEELAAVGDTVVYEICERSFASWAMGQVHMSRLNPALVLKYSEGTLLDPYAVSGKASLALFNELVETASIGVQH